MSPQGRLAGIFLFLLGPDVPQALLVAVVLDVNVTSKPWVGSPDIHGLLVLQGASEFPTHDGC